MNTNVMFMVALKGKSQGIMKSIRNIWIPRSPVEKFMEIHPIVFDIIPDQKTVQDKPTLPIYKYSCWPESDACSFWAAASSVKTSLHWCHSSEFNCRNTKAMKDYFFIKTVAAKTMFAGPFNSRILQISQRIILFKDQMSWVCSKTFMTLVSMKPGDNHLSSWKLFSPVLNAVLSLSVSISSDRHISPLQGNVVCRKHQPLQDIVPVGPSPLVLIITLVKPFHSGDEHPMQTVNKQVGYFHEASSQKLIAPQNWLLPTVNSNYCTHGFLSLSYI